MWWSVVGVVMAAVSPPVLRWLTRRGADAGVLLLAWAMLVCTLIAVALPGLAELIRRCWLAMHAGPPGGVDMAVGVLSGGLVALAAVRGRWHLATAERHRRRLHARHAELAWLLHGSAPRAEGVLCCPPLSRTPTALRATRRWWWWAPVCASASTAPRYERWWHTNMPIRSNATICLSGGPTRPRQDCGGCTLTRQSPSLVRTLVELDADAHAARVHGNRPLRRALLTLQNTHAPALALGIAGECVQLRLQHLSGRRSPSTGRIAASAAASTAMLLAGTAALVVAVLISVLASCTAG